VLSTLSYLNREMDTWSFSGRQAGLLGLVLIALLVLSAFLLIDISQLSGEEKADHLFIEVKDIKSETCLTCHTNKKEGKFVHSAVGMGCESCHQMVSENGKTTVTPVATGGDLCAMCHKARKGSVLHGPYKNGQCLTCHDPHASDFKAQTRAPGNSLCLECHAPRRVTKNTVVLFNARNISDAEFEAIPKIELDATQSIGHPWMGHPVTERLDPLHQGEKMSCLSCHQPHASQAPMLIHFDRSIVSPSSDGRLEYQRTGVRSGTCYLTCHGKDHNPKTYH